MTRLPKGWRGKTGVRGVYVKAHSNFEVQRDFFCRWRGYEEGEKNACTMAYDKATDAMKAVDRLMEEKANG